MVLTMAVTMAIAHSMAAALKRSNKDVCNKFVAAGRCACVTPTVG
jgi:hypothetical protein